MNKQKSDLDFLLIDRTTNTPSREDEVMRSTWESLSKGKQFKEQELREIFAFDFSDIIPTMKWDQTTFKQ